MVSSAAACRRGAVAAAAARWAFWWKAEPGEFEAMIGNSSDNLAQKVKFKLK